jgi:DNA-binding SARP family transcriptional activator/tetratricopeptide (TPR) repeat protein
MRYRVLGPVTLRPRTPTAAKVRVLLATLLVRANEVVSSQALIDELWGDEPPRTAATTLQVYVSQLRNLLAEQAQYRGPRDSLLRTQPPGYRIQVGPEELDLSRFEILHDSGRRAYESGDYEKAGLWLREALGLWSGAALSGIPHGPLLSAAAVHLEESKVAVLEQRIAADLRLGRHTELIAELLAMAAEHPYREALHAHLMVALYRSERQSDALLAFRSVRRALIDELGVEPGPRLARLHERILRSDPALAWQERKPAAGRPPVSWLPPTAGDLVGRDRQLASAVRMIEGEGEGGSARLLVVSGNSGVGKTAFAVELARRHAESFPDGQALVELRGARGEALDPGAAAAAVLHRVEPGPAPGGPRSDARQELERALHGRRLLLVLDDAASEAQVRPVAAALDDGLLLVTSRRGLVGLDDARQLTLEVLTPAEAQRLLAAVAGAPMAEDPAAAREIARLCGRLPLALRVAGAALNARPHWTAATLAERLADQRSALDLLTAGDLDVRAALMVGYRELGAAEQRAFRLLSIAAEPGFALWSAAVLLGTSPAQAEQQLELLVEARLLENAGTARGSEHRYGYHRLLRSLAQERLRDTDSEEQRRDAADRLGRAYLALARYADGLLMPGRSALPAHGGTGGSAGRLDPAGIVGGSPVHWFQQEIHGLLDAVRYAAEAGNPSLVLELARAVSGYLEAGARWGEWSEVLDLALDAAVADGDDEGRAEVLRMRGDLAWQQRRTAAASGCYTDARQLFEQVDDPSGVVRCLIGAGDCALSDGDPALAERCYREASERMPAGLDERASVDARRGLALVALVRGRAEDALERFQEFTEAAERLGDQRLARFGQRNVERILEHLVDWSHSQRMPPPLVVEARPGVWLVQAVAGSGV